MDSVVEVHGGHITPGACQTSLGGDTYATSIFTCRDACFRRQLFSDNLCYRLVARADGGAYVKADVVRHEMLKRKCTGEKVY